MRIESSAISMASDRKYVKISEASSETTVTQIKKPAAQTDQSGQLRQDTAEITAKQNDSTSAIGGDSCEVKSMDEIKLEILKKMLEAMKKLNTGGFKSVRSEMKRLAKEYESAVSTAENKQTFSFTAASATVSSSTVAASTGAPSETQWRQTTVESSFFAEMENTAYQANGVVKTADGREINFGVSIEMTRAFCENYKSVSIQENICTDPLVINLDTNIASVSDQKFLFDINSDGQNESISFTKKGSGFLALDKNSDGVINNGSELFGTRSGDGFADLAAFDSDGNNWIDESDAVFSNLKIWTKDESGKDAIVNLKESGVGAIYLGRESTEFSLNNVESNQSNGIIRSTGIYLKESGEVGTIQHVDLTM